MNLKPLTFLFLFLLATSQIGMAIAAGQQRFETYSPSLTSAETALSTAFVAVSKAEKAGANVSDLIQSLYSAGIILEESQDEFRQGNSDNGSFLASTCANLSAEIKNNANDREKNAASEIQMNQILAICGSALAIIFINVSVFLLWRFFKKKYYNKILKMKLRITKNES